MRLRIQHETVYAYVPAVDTAQHIVHLKPRNTACQKLLQHRMRITPQPSASSERMDAWGNTRSFFSLQAAHDELRVVAESLVDTSPPAPLPEDGGAAWEAVRERFRFRAGSVWDRAAEFVFASEYVPQHEDFAAYARPVFQPGMPVLQAADALMRRIHDDFLYESDSTDVGTPAVEALAQRRGVCQDFAHIMIGCLRAQGIPARYVSGYLLTVPPPGQARLVGSDASHAWVSVYAPPGHDVQEPGAWWDFDPTNRRRPGEDYVTIAHGRDFGDVSPMRGLLHGGGEHTLDVGVTVEPIE
ncbi:transglutaminase family protein [Xylophilus rhododendri]|uniref:Transglutaminase family protein n=1 Tax=Xylophilus rhododendri TaxID=2697032 RepID=A0A857J092_9BURK|nr:transglutaminase family protein [Xylophilus rhododendri]QHI97280.1 transglutaminase family protein [Xylophilus rhododendri]